jgi:hypothetical protein
VPDGEERLDVKGVQEQASTSPERREALHRNPMQGFS